MSSYETGARTTLQKTVSTYIQDKKGGSVIYTNGLTLGTNFGYQTENLPVLGIRPVRGHLLGTRAKL